MSELTNKVRRMLAQAQKFVTEAPLEAVSRTQLALRTATDGLSGASAEERAELKMLIEQAETSLARSEEALAAWSGEVRARAQTYTENERKRLQQPLPPKV